MQFRKILWSIIKWLFRLIRRLLLFALWTACELFAVVFASLAKYLKGKITS